MNETPQEMPNQQPVEPQPEQQIPIQSEQPVVMPQQPQTRWLFLVLALVIALTAYVGMAYWQNMWPFYEEISYENGAAGESTPTPTPRVAPTSHVDYKRVVNSRFDYGEGEQQFGIGRVAGGQGPSSFNTDSENNLYVIDQLNNRVKVFDSEGNQISIINVRDSQNRELYIADVAVDRSGNVYVFSNRAIYKYSSTGSLLGTLNISDAPPFVEHNAWLMIYIANDNLYILDANQYSSRISSTEGEFKLEDYSKVRGTYGNSGKRYFARMLGSGGGLIEITDQNGIREPESMVVTVDGLISIMFLGEDKDGNFYIQVETTNEDDTKIGIQVFKYDKDRNLIASPIITGGLYSIWTRKLLHIDQAGDIWQVSTGQDNLYINRWSTVY